MPHEKVICSVPVGRLAGDLLHDTADTLDSYLAKQNRYTSLQAEKYTGKPVRQARSCSRCSSASSSSMSSAAAFVMEFPALSIGDWLFHSFIIYAKIRERQRSDQWDAGLSFGRVLKRRKFPVVLLGLGSYDGLDVGIHARGIS